ncbi:hypothetical protein J2852_006129 [Azospirillum soli]|nr:hypothetical protein [Azospirillum soli]
MNRKIADNHHHDRQHRQDRRGQGFDVGGACLGGRGGNLDDVEALALRAFARRPVQLRRAVDVIAVAFANGPCAGGAAIEPQDAQQEHHQPGHDPQARRGERRGAEERHGDRVLDRR